MNILSLFDGISSGQIALQRAGIKVDNYFASEIDKHAIKVTQYNFPNTIQLGSVVDVKAENLPKIDLLLAGSPCQGFSFAGKQLNFEDPRSKLFFEFVRLLKECRPKYFLLENVRMKNEYQDIISNHLGVKPIEINSSLVSAQSRHRLYWTNIPNVALPQDRSIVLYDILELKPDIEIERNDKIVKVGEIKGGGQGNRIYSINGKGISLTASSGGTASSGNMLINIPEGWEKYVPNNLPNFCDPYNKRELNGIKSTALRTNANNGNMWIKFNGKYRNLTRIECERLQTVPYNYTISISEPKAKKCLGNGWTVDVIAHIFKNIQ